MQNGRKKGRETEEGLWKTEVDREAQLLEVALKFNLKEVVAMISKDVIVLYQGLNQVFTEKK
jgi:hypothetical protein